METHENHGVLSSELVKFLPKLSTVDGKNDRELYDFLKAAAHQLAMRGVNLEILHAVHVLAACFTGKLGRWHSDNASYLNLNS